MIQDIKKTVDLGDGHQIEVGAATWNRAELSVWNRYAEANGRSSPQSSSEIPLHDVEPLVEAVAKWDLLDEAATSRLLKVLAESLIRRFGSPGPLPLQTLLDSITGDNLHAEIETGAPQGNEAW